MMKNADVDNRDDYNDDDSEDYEDIKFDDDEET